MKIFNGILVHKEVINLTGQKFNKLTVLEFSHVSQGNACWLCRCECGNNKVIRACSLKAGSTKSCGNCPNEIIEIDDKSIEIVLHSKKYGNQSSIIDKEDYGKIKNYRWIVHKSGRRLKIKFYVKSTINKKNISLHRLILSANKDVDHINGNSLDNRKENLREVTKQQNSFNAMKTVKPSSSKYKGVFWNKLAKKWVGNLGVNGTRVHLGYFNIEEDAARAYNEAAIKYFGEFANLNLL